MSLYLIAESTNTLQSALSYAVVILQVAAGLGFVIFVHELGHFLVAKACGVKCEKFYIGFDVGGRKFWSRQWGETEYGIGVVPLGGYVKMLGQDDNPSNMAEENERAKLRNSEGETGEGEPNSDETTEELDPRSYMAKTVPQRMAIISAGVIMNLIFGFIFAVIAFRIGVNQTPAIANDVSAGSPAWKADIRPGSELTQIGDRDDISFRDIRMGVALFDKEHGLDVMVLQPGSATPIKDTLHPKMSEGRLVPAIGVVPPSSLIAVEPTKGTFLADNEVGLEKGDVITAIDGNEVSSFHEIVSYLTSHRDSPIVLTVLRKDKTKPGTSEKAKTAEASSTTQESGKLVEVTIPPRPTKRLGLVMEMGPVVAVQEGSPASDAGLREGDLIVELNGAPAGDPETLSHRALKAGQEKGEIELTVVRKPMKNASEEKDASDSDSSNAKKEERITKTLKYRAPYSFEQTIAPGEPFVLPGFGLAYGTTNEVFRVIPDSPAAKAGVESGSTVMGFNLVLDKEVKEPTKIAKSYSKFSPIELDDEHLNWPYVASAIDRLPSGLDVELKIKSGKSTKEVTLSPVESDEWNMAFRGSLTKDLKITRTATSWSEAVSLGGRELWYSVTMVYRFLQKIGHQISPKALGGPITIAQAAGLSAFEGFGNLLVFLTMLSANLAVINFLPIPVLDGGHMVFLAWEGIFRKPMPEKIVIAFHMVGFAMIISLMLFVIGLDIFRIFGLT